MVEEEEEEDEEEEGLVWSVVIQLCSAQIQFKRYKASLALKAE